MPYLTPPDLPEEDDCRPLFIPASTQWLALFGGALTELTKAYNWEDSGGLTVEETVNKMNDIINQWYAEVCTDCAIPGTSDPPFRIGTDGRIEELVDGEWVPPEGDYELPPITPREGGTEEDQICLAARNAVNVLQQLYESLSDSFGMDLSADEALLALIELLVTLIGVVFAPIAYALAQLVIAVFTALFAALEWITEDLWTEDFSNALTCILINCASNVDGVVTFDYDCVYEGLSKGLDGFDISADQARLYLQITYLLQVIGGADAINLAGATTAITDDNCDFCIVDWCCRQDFEATDAGWTVNPAIPIGAWTMGTGWHDASNPGGGRLLELYIEYDPPVFIRNIAWDIDVHSNTNGNGFVQVNGSTVTGSTWSGEFNGLFHHGATINDSVSSLLIAVGNGGSTVGAGGTFEIPFIQIAGSGEPRVDPCDDCV